MLPERLLERMEYAVTSESLHSFDLHAFALDSEEETRAHRRPVHKDGASSTYPVLTAEMCASQTAVLANRIGEGLPRLDAN
jgi:hypothetical protein